MSLCCNLSKARFCQRIRIAIFVWQVSPGAARNSPRASIAGSNSKLAKARFSRRGRITCFRKIRPETTLCRTQDSASDHFLQKWCSPVFLLGILLPKPSLADSQHFSILAFAALRGFMQKPCRASRRLHSRSACSLRLQAPGNQ